MQFIDFKAQYNRISSDLNARIEAVLSHNRYLGGAEITELEGALATFTAAGHCITTSSGTDALLMGLMALDVGPGDEVITSPFSFISVVEMTLLLGAKPVFVDIDPKTYNLDPSQLEQAITPKTKVIVPISLYGQCADFDAINAIAERHNLPVIDDAAQSLGALYKGRPSGSLATISCTSFYPTKPLGAYGDGGACFTSDESLALRLRQIRDHGQSTRYHHAIVGICGRLDTLQAAVLLAKLNVFKQEIALRQQAADYYSKGLQGRIASPYIEPHNSSVYAQYTIRVDERDHCCALLGEQGVPVAVHYPMPLHAQPICHFAKHQSFPEAEKACLHVMSLPMHPDLTRADQDKVIESVLTLVGG